MTKSRLFWLDISNKQIYIIKGKSKSAVPVEANSKDCIGDHNKQGGDGQDPVLWKRINFWSTTTSSMCFHEEQIISSSPVIWRPLCKTLFVQDLASAVTRRFSFSSTIPTVVAIFLSSALLKSWQGRIHSALPHRSVFSF